MTTWVLDNEAVQALADPAHRKHRAALAILDARAVRAGRQSSAVVVPTVVRVEARVSRQDPGTSSLGRLRVADVGLSGPAADQAVTLRAQEVSVVDACVAQVALDRGGPVVVVTSDVHDLSRLLTGSGAVIQRL